MLISLRFVAITFFCLLGLASHAKPPADAQRLLGLWHKGEPGAVVVAWVDRDGVTFFDTGTLSPGNPQRATTDTRFEIGSVTKVFTALLLAESERQGRVKRTDPVAKYLLPANDPLAAKLEKITLLSLVTHTSGLPEQSSNFTSFAASRDELIEGLRRDGPEAIPAEFAYSNFGVALLGEALANAWQGNYAEVLQARVLKPLGLMKTSLRFPREAALGDFATGHFRDGSLAPSTEFGAYAPAGGLTSSARELAKFLQFCLSSTDHPLRAALLETLKPQPSGSQDARAGLGWRITNAARPLYWHTGETFGYQSYFGFDPQRGAGIAILASNKAEDTDLLANALLNEKPVALPVPIERASDYLGRYSIKSGGWLDITAIDGFLYGRSVGGTRFLLTEVSRDSFTAIGAPLGLSFERNGKQVVTGISLSQAGRRPQRGKRGEIPEPPQEIKLSADLLAEYAGEYALDATTLMTVVIIGEQAVAKITGQLDLPLHASGRDRLFSRVEEAEFEFRRDGSGKIRDIVLHQNGEDVTAARKAPR